MNGNSIKIVILMVIMIIVVLVINLTDIVSRSDLQIEHSAVHTRI